MTTTTNWPPEWARLPSTAKAIERGRIEPPCSSLGDRAGSGDGQRIGGDTMNPLLTLPHSLLPTIFAPVPLHRPMNHTLVRVRIEHKQPDPTRGTMWFILPVVQESAIVQRQFALEVVRQCNHC